MSNFAEFDVPEPNSQTEETSQTETNKEADPSTQAKTSKPKPTASKRKNGNSNFSFLLAIIGLLAVFPVAFKTVSDWFKTDATFPFQAEVSPYNLILIIVAFVCFKLAGRNPLAKLGMLIFYITAAGWIAYKVYQFVTTGVFNWS